MDSVPFTRRGLDMPPDENVFAGQHSGIHTAITCNGCGASPLSGIRHLCLVCKHVNLCTACFDGRVHVAGHDEDDHFCLRIHKSGRDARSVLCVQLVDDGMPLAVKCRK